jgi:phosphoribosyl-ATP pyrophosphohydrolase/phosphoribosyl-AMP cyclohydrolase
VNELQEKIDWAKGNGLVPAVLQDATSGRVLMLAYMNEEALAKTLSTGLVTFYSRSRQRLWTKGEESGNTLTLQDIQLDCDNDTLLIQALPAGPTCHLNKTSCFDDQHSKPGFGFIGELENIIRQRMEDQPEQSYTAGLAQSGVRRIAQKIGEEGVEVALAAATGDRAELVEESADLLFHVLVLLKQQDLSFEDIATKLQERHAEKQTISPP